ncbi:co-chaperone GroES [bacterium]|nr:co-chaperone GroES [bacterium]
MGKAKVQFVLRPLGDRVVVERLTDEDKVTSGGIVIPDSALERPQKGRVVAIGPGKKLDDGTRVVMDVEVGDYVYHGKYGGTEIKIGGVEYLILREDDIIGVVQA